MSGCWSGIEWNMLWLNHKLFIRSILSWGFLKKKSSGDYFWILRGYFRILVPLFARFFCSVFVWFSGYFDILLVSLFTSVSWSFPNRVGLIADWVLKFFHLFMIMLMLKFWMRLSNCINVTFHLSVMSNSCLFSLAHFWCSFPKQKWPTCWCKQAPNQLDCS